MKEAGRKIRKIGRQRRGEKRACMYALACLRARSRVRAVEEKTRERESIDPTLSPATETPSWPNFTPPLFHPSVVVCCIPICLIFFPSIPPPCLSLSCVRLSSGALFFPSKRFLWPTRFLFFVSFRFDRYATSCLPLRITERSLRLVWFFPFTFFLATRIDYFGSLQSAASKDTLCLS